MHRKRTMQTSYIPDALRPIVVSVVHKDPLVRAGVVATLSAQSRFVVRLEQSSSGDGGDANLAEVARDVDVVIADYDRAMLIAGELRKSRDDQQAPTTKIMIVSERDGELQVRHALETGIQGYLSIDCRPEEIADGVIALHCGQRRLGQLAARRVAESFDHEALTHRQIEVLRLVVAGCANKIVARELDIALGTVKVHVKSIMTKLGARTRTEAAAVAQRRGLIGREETFAGEINLPSYASSRQGGVAIPSN